MTAKIKNPKNSAPTTATMHSASGRLEEEDYRRMCAMVDRLNTNVCAFVTESIKSTLDLLEADKPSLPKYVAVYRYALRYEANKEKPLK